MPSSIWRNSVGADRLDGRGITILALMISFPAIGLDLFLRTSSGSLSAQPYVLAGRWVTDSLIMLPLFAFGVWAGDRIASLAGLCAARRADVVKRALLITLLAAVAQVPAWFAVNKSDNPVTAQPLVAPQAHDSGDVYSVAPWVLLALVCVCLAPAAVWAALALTSRVAPLARGAVLVLLLASAPALAWTLHQAAERAYASQVYYTSAAPAIARHSHSLPAAARTANTASTARTAKTASTARTAPRQASAPVTAAPNALVYQAAHALQDGLAGQAAGFPVAVIALLWGSGGLTGRNQHHPAITQGGVE